MQNINLHKAQFPSKKIVEVSGKWSTLIIVIFVVSISGTSLFYWKMETLKKEYTELKKTTSITQITLAKINAKINASTNEKQTSNNLLSVNNRLKHKQALKNTLDAQTKSVSNNFYRRFVTLSKLDIDGLWLNEISFLDNEKNLTLRGTAINPQLITRYIQKLSNEPVFSGIEFTLLQVNLSQKNGNITFNISSDGDQT